MYLSGCFYKSAIFAVTALMAAVEATVMSRKKCRDSVRAVTHWLSQGKTSQCVGRRPLGPAVAAGGVSGSVLQVCLRYYEHELVELACQCPAVVCCRCSPTQKARIVKLLRQHTHRRTCAIGESSSGTCQPMSLWPCALSPASGRHCHANDGHSCVPGQAAGWWCLCHWVP